MKNIKSFDSFINEEVNWGKQPWKFIKNLMSLEEKDEEAQEKKNPDDIVEMTTTFQLSILRSDTPNSVGDAMELLMKRYHLMGTVYSRGGMRFELQLKGKRKDADAFYDQLQKLIRS